MVDLMLHPSSLRYFFENTKLWVMETKVYSYPHISIPAVKDAKISRILEIGASKCQKGHYGLVVLELG